MSISQHKRKNRDRKYTTNEDEILTLLVKNMPRKSPCIPSLVDANVIYIRPLKMLLNLS